MEFPVTVCSPLTSPRPLALDTLTATTASAPEVSTRACPTGYSSEDVLETSRTPSLKDVMAISDPALQQAAVKSIFTSLPESKEIPTGSFRGDFVGLYTGSAVANAVVPFLWDGVTFDGDLATLSLNPWVSWFLPQESGTVSLAESVYDGRPTLRVDYEDRFWESRKLDDNRFLSIVTSKETGDIGDIHTLTRTS